MATPIGYQWLISNLALDVPSPAQISLVGEKDSPDRYREKRVRIFRNAYRVDDDPVSHLSFALKHEPLDLAVIDRAMEKIDTKTLESHFGKHLGRYERKIGFYYEFLTGQDLDVPKITTGNYVDLLDAEEYFTAPEEKNKKWRINNNLLGTREFCPVVRKTLRLKEFVAKDFDVKVRNLMSSYPSSIILRANQYLCLKETRSSFLIEREEPKGDRIQRFVQTLQRMKTLSVLTKEDLIRIQNMIVGRRFASKDYRADQNYVGERLGNGTDIVHYIPPSPDSVPSMMKGLLDTMSRIRKHVHPVIQAAGISFGFVFIHPFDDGNGRIHRFLIQEILARENFTPENAIFPVSAHILNDMADYDKCLGVFSEKVMEISQYDIDAEGVVFKRNDTDFLCRYFDATAMAEYLFKVIEETLEVDIPAELDYLLRYERAKKEMQTIVDMPDNKIDLFIQVCRQNDGILSGSKRKKLFPILSDDEVARLARTVKNHLPVEKSQTGLPPGM